MAPNSRGQHAYFPALFICIAFTDLLSGLHAGKLWPSLEDLKRYVAKFIRHPEYTPDHVNLLYECLRHKVAHLAYPYAVFDTATSEIFKGQQRHLVTWTINASDRRPARIVLNRWGAPAGTQRTQADAGHFLFTRSRCWISGALLDGEWIGSIGIRCPATAQAAELNESPGPSKIASG